MQSWLGRIRGYPRIVKRTLEIAYDCAALSAVGWLGALWLSLSGDGQPAMAGVLAAAVLGVAVVAFLGGYSTVLRYMGRYTGFKFAVAAALSAIVWGMAVGGPSASLLVVCGVSYWLAAFALLFGPRLTFRELAAAYEGKPNSLGRVAIYGAGSAGRQILEALRTDNRYRPVLFIDDDPGLRGLTVQGLRVHDSADLNRLMVRYQFNQVFFAIPSAPRERRSAIFKLLAEHSIRVQTVPELHDLIDGEFGSAQLRPVEIEDMIDRDEVPADPALLRLTVEGRVVLVTGAGGSIGSELCRSIFKLRPATLVLFDISEFALYSIEQELSAAARNMTGNPPAVEAVLGSVINRDAVAALFRRFQFDTVFHAAAYKHVPLLERNIVEGVQNNVFGTKIIAEEAVANRVSTFVFVSTDKAVRPTSVMGASKRIAEMIVQICGEIHDCDMSIVRFGNVLGSSGSVLPLFKEQIAAGGPITVTHPEVTRFFMTIPEAAQLVIQAGALGRRGDVFHLDMGKPVRIIELARRLLQLYGLNERKAQGEEGVEIRIVGLRPGEKLYEELLIGNDARPTRHPRIFGASEAHLDAEKLEFALARLALACERRDESTIMGILTEIVEGFTPDVVRIRPVAQNFVTGTDGESGAVLHLRP